MFLIVPVIGIVTSLLAILSPHTAWYLQVGWQYKNLEPSDGALIMVRIGGIIGVIACIAIIVISLIVFA